MSTYTLRKTPLKVKLTSKLLWIKKAPLNTIMNFKKQLLEQLIKSQYILLRGVDGYEMRFVFVS